MELLQRDCGDCLHGFWLHRRCVETAIKYLRHSFFYGRTFSSLEGVRKQCASRLETTANARLHATTHARPAELLLVERPRLVPLPKRAFDSDVVLPLVVSKEARVRLDTNSYSVPYEYVGKTVHQRADDVTVRIIHEQTEFARHARSWQRHQAVEKEKVQEPTSTDWKTLTKTVWIYLSSLGDEAKTVELIERMPVSEIAQVKISLGAKRTVPKC